MIRHRSCHLTFSKWRICTNKAFLNRIVFVRELFWLNLNHSSLNVIERFVCRIFWLLCTLFTFLFILYIVFVSARYTNKRRIASGHCSGSRTLWLSWYKLRSLMYFYIECDLFAVDLHRSAWKFAVSFASPRFSINGHVLAGGVVVASTVLRRHVLTTRCCR